MITLIIEGIIYAISCILFYAEVGLGYIVDMLYDIFEVFVGAKPIIVSGESTYILELFFNDSLVSTLYWGMAVIGIALSFGFAVIAVVKKIFDITGEKIKATYGQILFNLGKSVLLILLMTALVGATITASGVLMDQITYLFDNAEELNEPSVITFTDEQYATMFRIIDNISNHGLNASYDNRFNINSCYNEVRQDLYELSRAGVFNYDYIGCEDSWQYSLRQLYLASDVTQDIPIDVVNEAVSDAIINIMNQAKSNTDFVPLSKYDRGYSYSNITGNFGRIMMLVGSFGAANNSAYDGESAGFTDEIRNPFYTGAKNIYSKSEVEDYFSLWIGDWRHLTVLLCEVILVIEFVKMLFNCVARVFNMILLYIISPGFISVIPLDDGGKMKQWTTAFVIQTLSIFGTFISVRLITIFVPIIMNSSVVLFDSGFKNVIAKVLFVLGICITAQRSSAMVSGILADNAGYQSIMAGNVGDTGLGLVGKATGFVASNGLKLGVKAVSAAGSLASSIGGSLFNAMSADSSGAKPTKAVQGAPETNSLRPNLKSQTPTTNNPNAMRNQQPNQNLLNNQQADPNASQNQQTDPNANNNAQPNNLNNQIPSKDLGANGNPEAIRAGQENNNFVPGSINSHIGNGEGAGGFKLDPSKHVSSTNKNTMATNASQAPNTNVNSNAQPATNLNNQANAQLNQSQSNQPSSSIAGTVDNNSMGTNASQAPQINLSGNAQPVNNLGSSSNVNSNAQPVNNLGGSSNVNSNAQPVNNLGGSSNVNSSSVNSSQTGSNTNVNNNNYIPPTQPGAFKLGDPRPIPAKKNGTSWNNYNKK